MKPSIILRGVATASLFLFRLSCHSAAFQNIDFEHPNLPLVPNDPDGYGRVPLADALSGWVGFRNATPLALVLTNGNFLSAAGISLFGPGESHQTLIEGDRIEGNYSAFLQSGTGLSGQGQFSTSLAQMGLVSSGSHSLLMRINAFGPFSVSLGGQMLSMIPLSVTPNFTLYGADITAFASSEAELRITADYAYNLSTGLHSYLWLDSISFSPMAVPEPGPITLLAAALAAVGLAHSFRCWGR